MNPEENIFKICNTNIRLWLENDDRLFCTNLLNFRCSKIFVSSRLKLKTEILMQKEEPLFHEVDSVDETSKERSAEGKLI